VLDCQLFVDLSIKMPKSANTRQIKQRVTDNEMIRNYLKIAWRNMLKHRAHTFINILGMAIAFICSILLLAAVYHEFSFDKFHQYKDRVFKLYEFHNLVKGTELGATMGYPVATYLKKENIGIDK